MATFVWGDYVSAATRELIHLANCLRMARWKYVRTARGHFPIFFLVLFCFISIFTCPHGDLGMRRFSLQAVVFFFLFCMTNPDPLYGSHNLKRGGGAAECKYISYSSYSSPRRRASPRLFSGADAAWQLGSLSSAAALGYL